MPAGTSFLIEKGMLGEKLRNVKVDERDKDLNYLQNQVLAVVTLLKLLP